MQTHDCGNWDCGHRNFFSGNICFKFSVLVLCSAGQNWVQQIEANQLAVSVVGKGVVGVATIAFVVKGDQPTHPSFRLKSKEWPKRSTHYILVKFNFNSHISQNIIKKTTFCFFAEYLWNYLSFLQGKQSKVIHHRFLPTFLRIPSIFIGQ